MKMADARSEASFPLGKDVADGEHLFRGIPDAPSFVKNDGTITSAALKDSRGGVSVDRDGGRPDDATMQFFCDMQKRLGKSVRYAKFLKMSAATVRRNECDVHAVPLAANPYHAEITQNGSGVLKRRTAKDIVAQSVVLDNPLYRRSSS